MSYVALAQAVRGGAAGSRAWELLRRRVGTRVFLVDDTYGLKVTWRRVIVLAAVLAVAITSVGGKPARKRVVKTSLGGNRFWATNGDWSPSGTPTAADDVIIANGSTMRMNANNAACNTLQVGQGTSGVLEFSSTGATRELFVTGNVTVLAGGIIRHRNNANSVHELYVGGNLSNAGTVDMYVNTSRYVRLIFNGGTNATISGAGVWDNYTVTFNKASQAVTVTNQATSNFWAGTNLSRTISYTSGTYVHDTATAGTMQAGLGAPDFDDVKAAAGITVKQGTLTAIGTTGNLVVRGKLRVEGGTMNIGAAALNALSYRDTTGVYEFVGGAVNISGRIITYDNVASVNWTHAGTTLTVGTVDTGSNSNLIGVREGSTLTWSSGSIILQQAPATGSIAHVALRPTAAAITGGTLQVGNASTTAGQTFTIANAVGVQNLTISNAGGTAKTLQLEQSRLRVQGALDIQSGTTLNANGFEVFAEGAWTNNGTFTAGSTDTSLVGFNGTTTISGSGTHQFRHVAVPGTVTLPTTTLVDGNLSSTGTINAGSGTVELNGSTAGAIRREYVNTSTGPAVNIPDNDPAGANSNLVVAGQGTISKVKVVVTVVHSFEDDLEIQLRHPDGTLVMLANNRGDVNGTEPDHFLGTMFDDAAGTPIAAGSPPYTGTFIPDGALSALDGKSANGTWQLFVEDTVPGDVGIIVGWSLYVTVDTAGSIGVNHLTVNASATKTAEWALDLNGNFTLSAGTFAPGSFTHTVGGHWNDSGGTFTPTAGTINFDGAAAQSITTGGSNNFFGVTMSNGGARTPATAMNIDGAFTLSGGSFAPGAFTHTVAGNWDDSGSSGGFTPGAGTIQFDATSGTQTLTVAAGNNFYNVTKTGGTATRQQAGAEAIDINGAFLLSAGTWDANSIGMEVAGSFTNNGAFTSGTQTVTLDGAAQSILGTSSTTFSSLTAAGSSTKTLNPGAGVETYVSATLTVSSTLALADSKILHLGTGAASGTANVTGTLLTTSGSSNKPTVTNFSAVSPRHDFNVTGTLDLDGLIFEYADASGMDVQPGGTILQLDNVAFQNIAAGGRHLGVNVASLSRNCYGCSFTAVGGGNNVVAVDTGAGDDLRLNFEFRSVAEHGAGAGESFDSDDDPDEDGLSAAGGAVVAWNYAIGTPQGEALAAYDLATFVYYGTYAIVSGSNGLSYVMLMDATGVVQYAYSFSEATYGTPVGPVWWDNDGGGANLRLYFGTTAGYLFRLNDSGAALAPAGGFPINMNVGFSPACNEVTSPCIADASRIYFGGREGGVYYLYSIAIGGGASWAWGTLPSVSAMRSLMGFAYDNGTYIYSVDDGGTAYRINASSGGVPVATNSGGGTMQAPVTISGGSPATQHLIVGSLGGTLNMIDADASAFTDYTGYPFSLTGGGAVRGAAFFDSIAEITYVCDGGGFVHLVKEGPPPAYVTGYPISMAEASALNTTPMLESGMLYVGNTNGKVYIIDASAASVAFTLNYGAGMAITGFGFDGNIILTTSNGKTYLLDPSNYPDPTP